MGENEVKNEENLIKKVRQEQLHDLIFGKEVSWQAIIYDLINTEQLDPWDINISTLTDKYLRQIQKLEEANFFVSSKVLLAAALLLRIKSEILLNKYIRSIDEILFGKKEEKKYVYERIELNEEIPELIPKSPMPRFRKVTLQELMAALNKAVATENRRIKKEIIDKNALREIDMSLPKRRISIKDKIKQIYAKVLQYLSHKKKVSFSELTKNNKEEKLISFPPLLHLDHQKRIWLEQEAHFNEIYIWHKRAFDRYILENPDQDPFKELNIEIDQMKEEMDDKQTKRLEKLNKDFSNPLAEMFERLG